MLGIRLSRAAMILLLVNHRTLFQKRECDDQKDEKLSKQGGDKCKSWQYAKHQSCGSVFIYWESGTDELGWSGGQIVLASIY